MASVAYVIYSFMEVWQVWQRSKRGECGANSWGRNVFKDGYQEITDSAFNKMMQPSGNRLVVYSDIKNLAPRIYPDLSSIRKAYENE